MRKSRKRRSEKKRSRRNRKRTWRSMRTVVAAAAANGGGCEAGVGRGRRQAWREEEREPGGREREGGKRAGPSPSHTHTLTVAPSVDPHVGHRSLNPPRAAGLGSLRRYSAYSLPSPLNCCSPSLRRPSSVITRHSTSFPRSEWRSSGVASASTVLLIHISGLEVALKFLAVVMV